MSEIRNRLSFLRKIDSLITAFLTKNGFMKKGGGRFAYRLDGCTDRVGWLGLNRGSVDEDGSHDVDPYVGIHCHSLNKLYRKLVPDYPTGFSATSAANLRTLVPSDADGYWTFGPSIENESVARSMVDAIKTFGIPFMRRIVEPDKLVASIADLGDSQLAWRLPVALMWIGRVEEAKRYVSAEEAKLGIDSSGWADFYRDFARNFFSQVRSAS